MNAVFKKDFLYSFLICLFLLAIISINYYTFGNFLYDTGREFLVPDAINKGSVPIKDVFISYFPLSYQINSLLFKIFGSSFDVLKGAGIISSFLIGIFMYFISREFVSEEKSLIATIITTFITMFNVSLLSNYIMPYSYAFVYGVLSVFISTFFAIKYIKEEKFLYPAFFFLGASFALKAEFIFLLIPYLFLFFIKKTKFKRAALSLIFYILPVLLSFFILFLNGFNFSDLVNYFHFMKNFMNSEILKYYNSVICYKNPFLWFSHNLHNLLLFCGKFAVCAFILFFTYKADKKWLNILISIFLGIYIFIFAFIQGSFSAGAELSFLVFPVFYILIVSVKKKDWIFVFLSLVSIFMIMRFNFIYAGSYLSYTMPFALLLICLYFSGKKTFLNFMLIFAIINVFWCSISTELFAKYEIKTDKGKILSSNKFEAKVINETLSFLENKTTEKDTVLVLPEGGMFNYSAGRKTNLKYYQLIPNHIEALGEEKIADDLSNNPPDYIIILNTDYSIYGTPRFCEDFGQKICEFVYKNYAEIKDLGSNSKLNIKILKTYK